VSAAAAPIIEVDGLEKSYGDNVVLKGIDLEVRTGETLIILGGSGSGKSTLMRCLIGLERPDTGSVRVAGTDIFSSSPQELAELRQSIGVAFQRGALFTSMTVGENIDLPLEELTALPKSTRDLIVRIKLALVGLEGAAEKFPSELSGGMQKRVAFARAMALDPAILFADEPSAGLDPRTSAGLDQLLIRLREVFGVTLIVVTHELDSAFAIGERIALIDKGKILTIGTPEEVRASNDEIVRDFLDRQPEIALEHGERYRRWMTGQ
jgi:phospholipid/cholesterol/gamma-HCH transport system ATP-binding protein